jgi:hypothetical protein
MYKTELEKGSYYDFILTNDNRSFERNISDIELFNIDVTQALCDEIGLKANDNALLSNISLTGYDNYFIPPQNALPDVIIDPEIEYQVTSGDTFCFHEVSGYTRNLNYTIDKRERYNQLNGGFYQGAFKLFGYPIEFFPNRMKKGWTVNMLIKITTGNTINNTLNSVFNNPGFIFYLGTRAQNKFSNLTNIEVTKLKEDYSFQFINTGNLYTTNYYTLDNNPYVGYYNIYNGLPYTGRSYNTDSKLLKYNDKFKDVINNAFGIRITDNGEIGYRTIYQTDPCYTGETQNLVNITNNSFIDYTSDCDDHTTKKIITKYFTIEESYTKKPIVKQFNNEYILISVIFDRDFSYDNKCQLKYGEYKRGSLKIYINGFNVYTNNNFNEIIPHELDTEPKYQEGVPFNISFGGGTQGLYESVNFDNDKELPNILDKFFAGSFIGGVTSIIMYSKPLYPTEIRDYIDKNLSVYPLYKPNGGRRVFIKSETPIADVTIYPIYATIDSIYELIRADVKQIKLGDSIQLILASEKDNLKQTFEIINTKVLKSVQYYNYITTQFELENKLDDFNIEDVERNGLTYKRYIHNKSDRGQVLIKLTF